MEQAQRELARGLYLLVKPGVHRPQHIDALASVLVRAPGGCPVFLTVRDPSGKDAVLKLGREYAVNPGSYPHEELTALLGRGMRQARLSVSVPSLDDHFVSPSPRTRSRIRQNAGATTRILANAATFDWQGTYKTVI